MQRLLWTIPLLGFSADALAWGLATHVYFSQLLIWAVPLLDPRLRAAARRLPHLVLAGACLPDLALVGPRVGTRAFEYSHRWDVAAGLVARADSDEARALAIGYASHLYVDIVAHNHFVPAHEQLWLKLPMVTHAAAEWAMDAHVSRHLFATPQDLVRTHRETLATYAADEFDCTREQAGQAVDLLLRGVRLLYGGGLHQGLYRVARCFDRQLPARFDAYASQMSERLPEFNRLLQGEAPHWPADLPCPERMRHLAWLSVEDLRAALPIPASLFASSNARGQPLV